jgi:hypothetical protein
MRTGEAMQGLFVMLIAPAFSQRSFFGAFQIWRCHRSSDELPIKSSQLCHASSPELE